ncbi:hypothetical protein V5O48_007521 [Marasmius crinis-equi]|uniref:Uncharacterized protein n=1 Tax=Marasmius crinis-equi TaxID=585013 RepID=A0ABR3FGG8_9AGAR
MFDEIAGQQDWQNRVPGLQNHATGDQTPQFGTGLWDLEGHRVSSIWDSSNAGSTSSTNLYGVEPSDEGNAEAGPSGGYDIDAPIMTPAVEESGHTTLAKGDPADVQNKNKNLCNVYQDFFLVFPESFNRYRDEDIEPLVTTFDLAPMLTRFEIQPLPPNWKEFLHLAGARYFLFEPKRIYTDANNYNLQTHRHAMILINEKDACTRKRHITLSDNVDIVTRSVFWLDSSNADNTNVCEKSNNPKNPAFTPTASPAVPPRPNQPTNYRLDFKRYPNRPIAYLHTRSCSKSHSMRQWRVSRSEHNFRDVYLECIPRYPIVEYKIDEESERNPVFKNFVEDHVRPPQANCLHMKNFHLFSDRYDGTSYS